MDVKGRELDVLEAVANAVASMDEMNEAYAYSIKKDIGKKDAKKGRKEITYKTVHSKLKNLESRELIEFLRERETKKGANAKIYGPTIAGIAKLLSLKIPEGSQEKLPEEKKKRLEKIIDNNQELVPLVFGKWESIKEILGGKAWFRLKRSSESYLQSFSWLEDTPYYRISLGNGEVNSDLEEGSEKESGLVGYITGEAARDRKELFAFHFWNLRYPQYADSPPFSDAEIKELSKDQEIRTFLVRLFKWNLDLQEKKRKQLRFLESQSKEKEGGEKLE